MSGTVSIGMVGCGGMAGAHRNGYEALWKADLRTFRIDATCDINEDAAKNMSAEIAKWQGTAPRVYTDLDEMLSKEKELQAADICTLHRAHHTLAIPCFEAGLHVTMEKPVALTLRASRLVLDAADKAGTVFQIGENYRRATDHLAIKWALDSGRIGKIRMLFWQEVREKLWYWAWREHRDQAGGGWMLDGGVHFADLARFYVGPVRSVYAVVKYYHPFRYENESEMTGRIEVDTEDAVIGILNFDDDIVCQWTTTTAAPGEGFEDKVIYGEEGSITFHGDNAGLKSRTESLTLGELVKEHMGQLSADEKQFLYPNGVTDTVATELYEFTQAVLHGASMETLTGWRGTRR